MNPVLNLSEGQVVFFFFFWGGGGGVVGRRNLKYRRTVINAAHEKLFGAALKTLGAGTCKTNFRCTLLRKNYI